MLVPGMYIGQLRHLDRLLMVRGKQQSISEAQSGVKNEDLRVGCNHDKTKSEGFLQKKLEAPIMSSCSWRPDIQHFNAQETTDHSLKQEKTLGKGKSKYHTGLGSKGRLGPSSLGQKLVGGETNNRNSCRKRPH